MNATVLPETLVRELTTAPAWRVQKEYAGVLFLLIELPADADGLLAPLLELASLEGEPLVLPSDLRYLRPLRLLDLLEDLRPLSLRTHCA